MKTTLKFSIACCALLLVAACGETVSTIAKNRWAITPPIPKLDIAYTDFEVDVAKGGTLELPNGTTINIPAQAFADTTGKTIEGKVKLKYREFHDATDVFLSGIPMDYDTAGQTRRFQTAGMFDIQAEQNGQKLKVANGKNLKVRMASYEAGTDYSFYQFSDQTGWAYKGISTPEINTKKKVTTTKTSTLMFPLDKKHFVFSFDGVLDVMFNDSWADLQTAFENPSPSKVKAQKYGFDILDIKGHYNITYKGNRQPSSFMLWKRLSNKNFPDWVRNGKYFSYEINPKSGDVYTFKIISEDQAQTFESDIQCVMPLKGLFAFSPEYWEKNYKEAMAKIEEEQRRMSQQAAVFRTFEVNQMGIYNYDKLLNETNAVVVQGKFEVDKAQINNETYSLDLVMYLPEDNKTVIKLDKSSWDKVALLTNNKARFITVLPNNSIGIYSAQLYQKIDFEGLRKQEKPSYTFQLEKKIDNLSSAQDLRKALETL